MIDIKDSYLGDVNNWSGIAMSPISVLKSYIEELSPKAVRELHEMRSKEGNPFVYQLIRYRASNYDDIEKLLNMLECPELGCSVYELSNDEGYPLIYAFLCGLYTYDDKDKPKSKPSADTIKCFKKILDHTNFNVRSPDTGRGLTHWAVVFGHLWALEIMLEHGVTLDDAQDAFGFDCHALAIRHEKDMQVPGYAKRYLAIRIGTENSNTGSAARKPAL